MNSNEQPEPRALPPDCGAVEKAQVPFKTRAVEKPGNLLRLPAVMVRCALGRSSIYAGVRAGTFVAPVRLSARAIGWREEEIDQWVAERISAGGRKE